PSRRSWGRANLSAQQVRTNLARAKFWRQSPALCVTRIQTGNGCRMSVVEGWEKYRVRPDSRVRLGSIAADSTEICRDKKSARKDLKACRKQIDELLACLAAEQQRSLLIVLQGVDASGKDGAVRKVFTGTNPQHCKVVSFKEPDREERLHDYLWRIYRALP